MGQVLLGLMGVNVNQPEEGRCTLLWIVTQEGKQIMIQVLLVRVGMIVCQKVTNGATAMYL